MSNQLFYQCQVLNTDDPLMLGRIRARRLIDNYDDILKSISDPPWNEQTDVWTERDPFIFNPLLPYYIYQTPKVDEMVLVMYLTSDVKFINQYYIQSTFYSPTATSFQYYQGGNKFMGTGTQISNPKPLKNSDGTYTDKQKHKGVFPEPTDNAILGRGSSDVVVKKDEILIRAGKYTGTDLKPNVVPSANQQRGFLQISRFDKQKIKLAPKKVTYIKEVQLSIKYLVEYHITNPENSKDIFNGYVYLYQLKSSPVTNSQFFTVDTKISDSDRVLVAMEDFVNLSKLQTINFINNFINTCDSSNVSSDGTILFSTSNKYPIYYRPQSSDYNLMTNLTSVVPTVNPNIKCVGELVETLNNNCYLTLKLVSISSGEVLYVRDGNGLCTNISGLYSDLVSQIMIEIDKMEYGYIVIPTLTEIKNQVEPSPPDYYDISSGIVQKNLTEIFKGVKLNTTAQNPGYGLIWKKGVVGKPTTVETKEEPQSDTISSFKTFGALGSDYVYLLSHMSAIPGKKKINFDDTLYGIPQEKFFTEIDPNTSSLVRGEELISLLELIVEFLLTHVHPFPGKAPLSVTRSLMQRSTLKNAMQNASNTILNKFIRLN